MLDDATTEVHDVETDVIATAYRSGFADDDERPRVAGSVGGDELRIGEEGASGMPARRRGGARGPWPGVVA